MPGLGFQPRHTPVEIAVGGAQERQLLVGDVLSATLKFDMSVQRYVSLSELVNLAYGLTPEETALLWQTAPPRMPIGGAG